MVANSATDLLQNILDLWQNFRLNFWCGNLTEAGTTLKNLPITAYRVGIASNLLAAEPMSHGVLAHCPKFKISHTTSFWLQIIELKCNQNLDRNP